MDSTSNALTHMLRLERLEDGVFLGVTDGFGTPNSYGGQLIGQALSAASQCVDGRALHSMHAYFLRPGSHAAAVEYRVNRLRDGGNFSARRVEAWQRDALLFSGICSFHTFAENLESQTVSVRDDSSPSDAPVVDIGGLSAALGRTDTPHPLTAFEVRGEPTTLGGGTCSDQHTMWFRWRGAEPVSQAEHASLFGWLSDFFLLPTALRLTGHRLLSPALQIASLDHALWMHRPFALTRWMRFDFSARVLSHSRAHASANVFDESGRLIASLAQEGVLQIRGAGDV